MIAHFRCTCQIIQYEMFKNRRKSTLWTSIIVASVSLIYSLTILLISAENDDEGTCIDYTEYPRQEGELLLYHFETISSTQDEAKKLLSSTEIPEDISTVVVTTAQQTNGRGTNGRQWLGARGNTFVTICIRQMAWLRTKLPMTLLPIKMGTIMAERIEELLQACIGLEKEQLSNIAPALTTIKWPNDVLVDEQKISGVLIESDRDWFLIGVGVNVAHTPLVPTVGPNTGRKATSIHNYCPTKYARDSGEYVDMARELGQKMAKDFSNWLSLHGKDNALQADEEQRHMLERWKEWVDWDMQLILRDGNDKDPVIPVDIEPDGRLRVRGSGGRERLVVTDYFL